ncbi:MAG: hypothetical protein FWE30_01245 [Bacteroidales bacterium]|nr:hypothetical protein [Bacteroidales bacterium]MCL2738054.1 hypothetical protein [Bacteroidales bacterium]
MTTMIIKDNSAQAKRLIEFVRTLHFVTVVEEKKKSFEEAAKECNAVSVDSFFDELNARIEKWPNHA